MLKSHRTSVVAVALFAAVAVLVPLRSPNVAAESAPSYVNAVDLDIVPAEMQNYLAAIKENGAAAIKEPGCRQFDIMVLASNPNHIFLYEVYDNEAAFQAHRATDHFKKYAATTGSMVAQRNARPMTPIAFHSKGQ
ncbi:MAG: putative quinol monooxygenase [Xanthobacteraceae bacterium]